MAKIQFPFHINNFTPEEFRQKAGQAGYSIPVSCDLQVLRRPFAVNGRKIENSMAVQPLEGLDACEDGSPSPLTLARYEKLAAQGAGIFWVEATAICPEGRDSLRQLWINETSLPGFRRLVQTIDDSARAAGHRAPYKILQLTHSGRCSVDDSGGPAPVAAFANPFLDPVMGTPQIATDSYLDELQERFGEAAAMALAAGFDAVELKLCHQYLFKELLCAYTRSGRYGGSQENRFRFALGAIDQVRRRLGTRLDIVIRLNTYDGIPWPYGWGMKGASEKIPAPAKAGPMEIDLTEVKELIRQLYRKGIRIFNLTTTSPRFAPKGNGYLDNFDETAATDPFAGVAALLKATKEIREQIPSDVHIIGTGLSWFGPFSAQVGAGGIREGYFDVAGFGRSVMADKDFISSILRDEAPDPDVCCIGCDSCFQLFFADLPTGCAVRRKAYRDLFRQAMENGMIRGSIIY